MPMDSCVRRALLLFRITLLAFGVTLATGCGESASITYKGHDYWLESKHPDWKNLRKLVGKLPTDSELRELHGDHIITSGRNGRGLPSELAVEEMIVVIGCAVAYGEPREDGSHLLHWQGHTRSYYADETTLYSRSTRSGDGTLKGSWRYIPKTWRLESVGSYVDGKRVGDWVFLHPDGTVRALGSFHDDAMQGPWELFRSDGEPDPRSGTYEAGILVSSG